MSEIKLPFDLNPVLTTYHHLAHPLGIIGGNIPDRPVWLSWLAHKYINCEYFETPQLYFRAYTTDPFFISDHIIDQIEFRIHDNTYKKLFGSPEKFFIKQIKNAIFNGFYVQGQFNERYIRTASSYQTRDFCHDYLIYGYSDKLECFYAAGYTSDGFYKEYLISFQEYFESIFQPVYKHIPLRFMRFNNDKIFETNYIVVLRDIRHYLNSTAFKGERCDTTLYGIAVWEKLIEYLSEVKNIDIRFTKIFMEHHKLMNMRLEYFAKEGMINPDLYEQYSQTFNIANQVYLLSIKYNLSPKCYIKDNCIKAITTVIEMDKKILPMVITQIEDKINVK